MARTFIRQETQIRNSDAYVDNTTPSLANFETNPTEIETDLNNIRSQLHNLHKNQAGNWYDDLLTPSTFEGGAQRGVDDLNQDLHDFEKKRVLRPVHNLVDVTVGAGDNFVILGSGELPTPLTAAVGAVTTKGTVVAAHGGTFGTHALSEVAGTTAISPKNLLTIVDGATRDPILSGGRVVYGLLQGESGLTDGVSITIATTTRAQISFVRINAAGNDLEAVPFADIENAVINYSTRERIALEDFNESDFLTGAIVDVPAGSTVTRQVAYDNQGATVVTTTVNHTLDVGSGNSWELGDFASATAFKLTEGSGGGTTTLEVGTAVDTFDVNAVVNDFNAGMTVRSGGSNPIEIGVTDGLLRTTSGDLEVRGTGELILNDGNMIAEGSWAGPGVKVSDTTTEVSDYESAFGGEVSLMRAIVLAAQAGAGLSIGSRVFANVTQAENEDVDIGGTSGGANLDAQLPDLSSGTFVDNHKLFWNGLFKRPGANAAANNDYYPGTSLALGQIKLEFKAKVGDVVYVETLV